MAYFYHLISFFEFTKPYTLPSRRAFANFPPVHNQKILEFLMSILYFFQIPLDWAFSAGELLRLVRGAHFRDGEEHLRCGSLFLKGPKGMCMVWYLWYL